MTGQNAFQNVAFTLGETMVAFEVRSGSTHLCIFLTTDTFVKRIVNFLSGRWKQLQCFCSGSRGTEQIALYLRAAKRPNCLQLLDRLYPLGGYPHAEASRQIHSGADDGAGFVLAG